MFRFIFIVLFLFFSDLHPLFSQQEIDKKEQDWIKNNRIKVREQYDYKYSGDKLPRQGILSARLVFDKDGRIVESINFRNGSVLNVSSSSFDHTGNKIQYRKYRGNKEKITFRQEFQYDAQGNKILETGFNGLEEFKNVFKYNTQGQLLEIRYFLEDKLDEVREYRYSGSQVEILVSDPVGINKFKIRQKRDDQGNVVQEEKIEKGDVISQTTKFRFDEKNNLIQEEKIVKGNWTERFQFKYSPSGELLEIWMEEPTAGRYLKNSFSLRPDGRIAEEVWKTSPTSESSYKKYTYDSKGQLNSIEAYFASYKYRVLSKFTYK